MKRFGPQIESDGQVTFRIWAPSLAETTNQSTSRGCASRLTIEVIGEPARTFPLLPIAPTDDEQHAEDGWFEVTAPVAMNSEYWVVFPDGSRRADPGSRFQPRGVHGPSQLIDSSAYQWNDLKYAGVAKADLILYELHIGTFTATGTYKAAIARLNELTELGVTAIELMPLAESAGSRNWGYDGVNLFAPYHPYGTPDELKEFIDAAHRLGLAVILDVVYNHFGPEGNYLHAFGGYVSQRHHTAWGDAPNLDDHNSRSMRDFILDNARYWIEEYHFDGLRLDAMHCLTDTSTPHIAWEIGKLFCHIQTELSRPLHLIAESNVYDPELLKPLSQHAAADCDLRGYGFDAVWCDDFLHSVFAVLQPGEQRSHREYHAHCDLNQVLQSGFVYQGTLHERRARVSSPSQSAPFESLVTCIQNHDFVGNHPDGLRLHQIFGHDAHRAAAALLLLSPSIPMLFMGEEFASPNPFLFFVDFGDSWLRTGVEDGRKREYPQHDWTTSLSPLSSAAFESSKIGEATCGQATTSNWYRDLIRLRKEYRAHGSLLPQFFNGKWEKEHQVAILDYHQADQRLIAFVRLHGRDERCEPLRIELSGKRITPLLTQNCYHSREASNKLEAIRPSNTVQDSSRQQWTLDSFGVLIAAIEF